MEKKHATILAMISVTALMLGFVLLPFNAQAAPNSATIKIEYSGSWSGSIGGDNSRSIEGTGTKSYEVEGDIITAVIQKGDDSSNQLRVSILVDGIVKESEYTDASYGVVTVSYSFPISQWGGDSDEACCGSSLAIIFIATIIIFSLILVVKRKFIK